MLGAKIGSKTDFSGANFDEKTASRSQNYIWWESELSNFPPIRSQNYIF